MEKNLPNGFTGFAKRKPGFESAADALRKSKKATEYPAYDHDEQHGSLIHGEKGMPYASHEAKLGFEKGCADLPDQSDAGGQSGSAKDSPSGRNSVYSAFNPHSGLWSGKDSFFPTDMRKFMRLPNDGEASDSLVFDEAALSEIPRSQRRWAWVEIDLNAINHNVLATKRLLSPSTHLMAVVKSDAYGHGAVQCARTALFSGADYLGVASIDEAVQLRKADIGAPILILSEPPTSAIPLLLAYDIMPTVVSVEFAVQYGEAADSVGKSAPYHLKVNTGMNRIGIRYDEVIDFLKQISFHRALDLVGTFTHFATADMGDEMEFRIQQTHFEEAIDKMRKTGIDPGIVHAANSAAIYRYPEVHYDMVRLGLSLYGYYPCEETFGTVDLVPAMTVHARISQVNNVPVGEGVSYGLYHRSAGFAKVCTIPIGYADGLRRDLSGRCEVILKGRQFPQVGMICMDQSMFEVDLRSRRSNGGSGKVEPQVGDEVLLVGAEGNCVITIDEIAEKLGTIPHEITIGFGCSRLPRVFV